MASVVSASFWWESYPNLVRTNCIVLCVNRKCKIPPDVSLLYLAEKHDYLIFPVFSVEPDVGMPQVQAQKYFRQLLDGVVCRIILDVSNPLAYFLHASCHWSLTIPDRFFGLSMCVCVWLRLGISSLGKNSHFVLGLPNAWLRSPPERF